MPNLDNALGLHEIALKLRAQRMEVLASNLANADTPNFKARDIDFKSVLNEYQNGASPSGHGLMTTNARHMGGNANALGVETQYRNPLQPSIDGNTVDPQIEKSKFMENALQYQATLSFIDGRISSLRKAIRGD